MREFKLSNHLEEHLTEAKRGKNGKILWGVGFFVGFIPLGSLLNPVFYVIGGLIFLLFLIGASSSSKEARVTQAGLEGEEILRNKLRQVLSDEYLAFFSLPLRRGDIDCFLVGPTGAYLFYAKNHRGAILYHDGHWSQKKVGRNGRIYDGEKIKDPSGK